MTYEVIKYIKGNPYRYLVRSVREGDRVRQVFVRYLGRADKPSREYLETEPVERRERIRRPAVATVSEAVTPTVKASNEIATVSGRRLVAPKIRVTSDIIAKRDSLKADEWLLNEAKKELEPKLVITGRIPLPGSPEDKAEFQMGLLKGINPKKMTQADKDTAWEILTGEPNAPSVFELVETKPIVKPTPEVEVPAPKVVPEQQQVFYHGSDAMFDIKDFKAETKGITSTTFGQVDVDRHGIFLSESPEFASEYGKKVTPIKTNIKNTADIQVGDNPSNAVQGFIDSLDPFGSDRDLWLLAKNTKQEWGLFDGELGARFTKYLKEQGFDSARFEEYLPAESTKAGHELQGHTLVVLDPNVISTPTPEAVAPTVAVEAETPKEGLEKTTAPITKEPWQMTKVEYAEDQTQKSRALIEAWNKAGSKGFPPTAAPSIYEIAPLAEKAGYIMPRDAEKVLKIPYHQLQVEAALKQGLPVPPEVLKDYPELAPKPAPEVMVTPTEPEKVTTEEAEIRQEIEAERQRTIEKAKPKVEQLLTIKPQSFEAVVYRGERPKRVGEVYASDQGDFGAGKYFATSKSFAKAYAYGGEPSQVNFKSDKALVLPSEQASALIDYYQTVNAPSEEMRLEGAIRLRNDLKARGYDSLVVSGYEGQDNLTIIDFTTPLPQAETAPVTLDNPYMNMPIERVRRDAGHGVKLAKEALAVREAVTPEVTPEVTKDWTSMTWYRGTKSQPIEGRVARGDVSYFTNVPEVAKGYAKGEMPGRIIEAELLFKNPKIEKSPPMVVSSEYIEQLKKEGYDALIQDTGAGRYDAIIFEASQAKVKPMALPKAEVTPAPEVTKETRNILWIVKDTSKGGQGIFGIRQLPNGKYQLTPSYTAAYEGVKQQIFNTKQEALGELSKYGTVEKGVRLEIGSTTELGLKQGSRFTDDFGNNWMMSIPSPTGQNQFKLDTAVKGQRISVWASKEVGWQVKRDASLKGLRKLEFQPVAIPKAETGMAETIKVGDVITDGLVNAEVTKIGQFQFGKMEIEGYRARIISPQGKGQETIIDKSDAKLVKPSAIPKAEKVAVKPVEVTPAPEVTREDFIKNNADLVREVKGRWGVTHFELKTRVGDYQKVGQITADSPEGVLGKYYDSLTERRLAIPKAEVVTPTASAVETIVEAEKVMPIILGVKTAKDYGIEGRNITEETRVIKLKDGTLAVDTPMSYTYFTSEGERIPLDKISQAQIDETAQVYTALEKPEEVTPIPLEITTPNVFEKDFIERSGEPEFYTPETKIKAKPFTQLISTQYDAGQKMNVRNVHIGKVGEEEAWADGFMLEIKPVPEKLKLVKGYRELAEDTEGKPRDFSSLVPDYSTDGIEVKPILKTDLEAIGGKATFLASEDKSQAIAIDSKYVDYFLANYPDAKFITKTGSISYPINVQSKGKTVGTIMPIFKERSEYDIFLRYVGSGEAVVKTAEPEEPAPVREVRKPVKVNPEMAGEILEGYRDLDEARETLSDFTDRDVVGYTAKGQEVTPDMLRQAIETKSAEQVEVEVTPPTTKKSIMAEDVILEESKEFASGKNAGYKAVDKLLEGEEVTENNIDELVNKAFTSPYAPSIPKYVIESTQEDIHDAYHMGFGYAVRQELERKLEETTKEIPYSRDLDIRNIEALPKGTGAKYLITLKGQGDELIAKQWARVKPASLKPDEVLVSMTTPVAEKIEPTAVKVIFNRPFGGSKGGFAIMDYKTTTPIDDPIAKQKIIEAYSKVKNPVGYTTYNSIHKETKLPYETILGVLKQEHINNPYSIHFNVDRMGKNIYFKLDKPVQQA